MVRICRLEWQSSIDVEESADFRNSNERRSIGCGNAARRFHIFVRTRGSSV